MTYVTLDSEDFRAEFLRSGRSPSSRLKNLGKTLNAWNKTRAARVGNHDRADLSIEDIRSLRQLINAEIGSMKLENPEIVADQILFLAIGAIRLQLQNKSDKPWELVNSSIAGFLRPQRTYNPLLMGLSAMSVAMVIMISMVRLPAASYPAPAQLFEEDISGAAVISEAGMNSVSNLAAIYKKMQEGQCQLPQAAMLQPEERQAFIAFVNNGQVDIGSADSLKKSLQYVNCLYPQKLMGPL
ncbi:MAG TPA: hypothetical protein VD810_06870 [Methylophilaceae bacterium]|nr:hypothetical protein [Methylophilaceae bacterium]